MPRSHHAQLFGQIPLPQSPRQEAILASEGFENNEKSVTLSDARYTLTPMKKTLMVLSLEITIYLTE